MNDPIIDPEVRLSKARADYYRRAAAAEVKEAVKHPKGSDVREQHENKARRFYFKVATAEEAVKALTTWFVK